ncbi:hypothetical protein L218DRAFT_355875 [Marasmius fiardii PR-910]|nr:hypothetical protein L218DRAFT_355875 [Marasmius fiardii PR-910]
MFTSQKRTCMMGVTVLGLVVGGRLSAFPFCWIVDLIRLERRCWRVKRSILTVLKNHWKRQERRDIPLIMRRLEGDGIDWERFGQLEVRDFRGGLRAGDDPDSLSCHILGSKVLVFRFYIIRLSCLYLPICLRLSVGNVAHTDY